MGRRKRARTSLLSNITDAKNVLVGKSRLIVPRPNRTVIAGWEASGSTFLYQVSKLLGLDVQKIHGKNNKNTDLTFFLFRDPRDIVCSNAKRVMGHVWQSEGSEQALLDSLDLFVKAQMSAALHESNNMPNVIFIRYESYFLKNEAILVSLVADQFLIPVDDKKIASILKETSIEANQKRSEKLGAFDNWDKDSLIHGTHISNKGKSGGWKEHFTPAVEERVKESLGALIIDLGYENNNDWSFKK